MKYLRIIVPAILILVLFLVGKIYYDTYTIEVRHYRIEHSRLAGALAGKKVAFISDLHANKIGPREKAVIAILQRENPDLTFLGGDYISFRGSYEPVSLFLGQLKNAYAVLGNTEYTNENGSCILCHHEKSWRLKKQSNVSILRNAVTTLDIGDKKIILVGLDHPDRGKINLKAEFEKRNNSAPTILLAHFPELFDEAANAGADLMLSGHNHGGQVFPARYLTGMIMVDPCFDYLEGFFQKGKTWMYVSRGVGNSILPFRLGVKPEVTFFEFVNGGETSTISSGKVSSKPVERITAGYSIVNLMDLFDISFMKPRKAKHNMDRSGKLFDFESETDLEYLNWECHKWFEMSKDHATSGNYSLRVTLPPGQYPGINFIDVENDWSPYRHFKMEVFNPEEDSLTFHVRIDDKKSGWEYEDRFDRDFRIQKGMNYISIPFESLRANITPRSIDLRNIERLMIFVPGNDKKRTFYIDNIRLE